MSGSRSFARKVSASPTPPIGCICRFFQQPLVKDEDDGIGVFCHRFPVAVILLCGLKVKEKIGKPYILCAVIALTCLHAQGAGKIALAASGRSGDEDVAAVRDVFTA